MHQIERHIRKLGIYPSKGDTRQDYLKRALASIANLKEREWRKLPDSVQEWSQKAAKVYFWNKANKIKKPLPDFGE